MNEATADNNGAYLSDRRHGNGCRQREREIERASERGTVAVRRFILPYPPIGPHETLLAMLSVTRDRQSPPRQKTGASLQ